MEQLQALPAFGSKQPDPNAHSRAVERSLLAFEPCRQSHSKQVRKILKARGHRSAIFSGKLFGEPAWDMLLKLYLAELEQHRVSIGSLCIGSRVPGTTGLRWIAALERQGLVSRKPDPLDGRRFFVRLMPKGVTAMHAYFSTAVLD